MGAFEVRRAAPADVPAIRACVAAAYARWTAVLGYKPYPATMDYAALVNDHDVWTVPSDRGVIGVLVLIDQAPKLLLDNVAVDPDHRGRGLGNLLLAHAISEAARGGYAALRLYTNEKMAENRAWYAAHGFVEERREVRADRTIVFMERPGS